MTHTVLIVEDNIIIAMDIKERLESHGYHVAAIAMNGESAVTLASKTHPDVVLMDVGLGKGINGIEAAQLIRRQHETPVVFVTGNSHMLDETEVFLDKPFEEQELLEVIDRVIGRP